MDVDRLQELLLVITGDILQGRITKEEAHHRAEEEGRGLGLTTEEIEQLQSGIHRAATAMNRAERETALDGGEVEPLKPDVWQEMPLPAFEEGERDLGEQIRDDVLAAIEDRRKEAKSPKAATQRSEDDTDSDREELKVQKVRCFLQRKGPAWKAVVRIMSPKSARWAVFILEGEKESEVAKAASVDGKVFHTCSPGRKHGEMRREGVLRGTGPMRTAPRAVLLLWPDIEELPPEEVEWAELRKWLAQHHGIWREIPEMM